MTKKFFRIWLDILMFILLVIAVNSHITSILVHEIIWVALFVLWCLHIILNFSFYKNMFKWKYTIGRVLWTILDLWILVAFILTIFSWVPLSMFLFPKLGLGEFASKWLHKIASHWWLILTGIHAWLHCVQLRLKLKNKSKIWFYILGVMALVIIWFWIYYFITKNFWITLFGGRHVAGWHIHWWRWWSPWISLIQYFIVWIWTMLLTSLILLVPRLRKK